MFNFRFSIKYKVGIRFRLKFFKYFFYSKILVLLVISCGEFKSLFNTGRCGAWNQFIGFSGISKSLVDIGGNLALVEFGKIPGLVELGRFLGYIDISENLRLIDLSGFPRFQFKVKAVNYKALLLATKSSK